MDKTVGKIPRVDTMTQKDGVACQRRLVTRHEYLLVHSGAEGTDVRVLALRTMRFRVRDV